MAGEEDAPHPLCSLLPLEERNCLAAMARTMTALVGGALSALLEPEPRNQILAFVIGADTMRPRGASARGTASTSVNSHGLSTSMALVTISGDLGELEARACFRECGHGVLENFGLQLALVTETIDTEG
jgi:hypothetical protein